MFVGLHGSLQSWVMVGAFNEMKAQENVFGWNVLYQLICIPV